MAVHTVSWLAQVWQWTVHMATEQEQLDNWVTEHTGSSITTVSVYTVETAHTHHMERSAVCFMSSRTGDNSELDQSHTAHTVTSSSLACKLNSISSSILEWSTISYHICKRSLSKHRVWTAFSTNLEFSYMAHRTQTWRFDCVSIMATASSWHQRQQRRTHIHIIQHMATWHSQHRIWLKVNTVSTAIQLQYANHSTAWLLAGTQYEDVVTQTQCTKLLVNHGIHTCQQDHCTILFETERDCVLAMLALSNSPLYTARFI